MTKLIREKTGISLGQLQHVYDSLNAHVLVDLRRPQYIVKLAKPLIRRGLHDLIFET